MFPHQFKRLLFFIVVSFVGCSEKEVAPIHQWKLQSQAVANSVDYIELERFADNVAIMSNGHLLIEVYPAGELAFGPGIFNAVKQNAIQMGNGWPNWWNAQHPAWAVLTANPFGFMNIDASMMFFYEQNGIELANQLSMPKGIIWRPAWWAGMEFGLMSSEPITGIDDLKDKKVRIGPGVPSELLDEATQSLPISLAPEQIKSSLTNREIDAVEWTTAAGVFDLGIHDISPNAIVPAVWQPSVLSDFLINQQAYDVLSDDLKAVLETAIKAYTLTTTLKVKVKDINALQLLKQQGVTLNRWKEDDINRWLKASNKVLHKHELQDEISAQILDQRAEFKRQYDEYYELFGPYD